MHDIRSIRDDAAAFDKGLARRGVAPSSEAILAKDAEWRSVTTELQTAQQRRNEASKQIGIAKRNGEDADGQRMARLVARILIIGVLFVTAYSPVAAWLVPERASLLGLHLILLAGAVVVAAALGIGLVTRRAANG